MDLDLELKLKIKKDQFLRTLLYLTEKERKVILNHVKIVLRNISLELCVMDQKYDKIKSENKLKAWKIICDVSDTLNAVSTLVHGKNTPELITHYLHLISLYANFDLLNKNLFLKIIGIKILLVILWK